MRVRRCGWLLALGFLLTSSGCSQVFWRPDLGGAMRLAAERNQIVVVAYWSPLNEDCMRMEREVFTNDEVKKCLGRTVPVRISSLTSKSFADDYGLTEVPSFVVFGPSGEVLRVETGYMNEASFRGMVEAARLSK
ncbi:MAG: thioredoxin family protein [Phycisphaerales bacterium]|nr:thioredoxin family protein [Phycisphaerales bacterium]